MRFSLVSLLVATALMAIAYATLAKPNEWVSELMYLIVTLLGCSATTFALTTNGPRKPVSAAFGIFTLAFLLVDEFPRSTGVFFFDLIDPPYDPDQNYSYDYIFAQLLRCWLALYSGIAASVVVSWFGKPTSDSHDG